jgi:PGAP1-like protein
MSETPRDPSSDQKKKNGDHCGPFTDRDNSGAHSGPYQQREAFAGNSTAYCNALLISIHVASVFLFALGHRHLLQHHSNHHSECDMTWSHRTFELVSTMPDSVAASARVSRGYQLYRFLDARDPRYVRRQQQLRLKPSPNVTATTSTTTISNYSDLHPVLILYIPGHGGSYEQSRSIGAHGTGLSTRRERDPSSSASEMRRIQQEILVSSQGGNSSKLSFFYDTFALDFQEQGSALHGDILQAQIQFTVHILKQFFLVNYVPELPVQPSRRYLLYIVGHSAGGYVAREAASRLRSQLQQQRQQASLVQLAGVVTMVTPHQLFRTTLQSANRSPSRLSPFIVVSVVGGVRDPIAPPEWCELQSEGRDQLGDDTLYLSVSSFLYCRRDDITALHSHFRLL